ncbi:transcriptional regulator, Crp/Fnr family [Methylobacterium sp. 4-46]|uniref:Crp/Fnr family transcriptional regulator n=1 Tax=unclassified Methylobacterium TaxID=2615210 RepID=UPI000152E242|nr:MULTISPECIES: Crp/Fnr family transcriptional regulator [Methylobacterium]ACA20476.1 transcriptional regulator, Crp/Fnr family [Methylobacterium sp. 4-46]WFT79644.1 Crp/Fnr family transcriptional regulator [Methylobacterium nodulans]
MPTYLIRKLEQFTRLSSDDKQALERAASGKLRRFSSREDIIREGEAPRRVNLILDGWACRYKVLEDGRRQIAAFLLPGDLCDIRMFILKHMDHSVGTLSPATVVEIPRETILDLTDNFPRLSRALWWYSLVEEATQREWTTNLGQRDALERMAHLLCEVFIRLRGIGLTDGTSCELPVTQAELADATGLSTVHVNRTLQDLRARGLVILRGKTLTVPDLEALQDAALFSPNYLHLDCEGQELDANDS